MCCHDRRVPEDRLLRIGVGVDVHRFADGRPLWVAGLHWPDEPRGLVGHSDGDVVAHAVCDAVLSGARLGDMGTVFGTADPRWDGAAGVAFVTEATRMLAAAGATVASVSVSLIGNAPRLSDRRDEAEHALSAACGAPVSLTATTTDGLGLTGRGEGLAAIANALVWAAPTPS
jgi:2-C-methyl-D-erythritol 2,4-cyclodiphosphate synthase